MGTNSHTARGRHLTRRQCLAGALGTALGGWALAGRLPALRQRVALAHQRRWRVAAGLNGFMSSAAKHGRSYPIDDVLAFLGREAFDGVELVDGWPSGGYPDPKDATAVRELRERYRRHGLTIFSIQTWAADAFQPDSAVRAGWLEQFRRWASLAELLGCECLGSWPGGPLSGQRLEDARERLIESYRLAAPIARDHGLLISMELEPPFPFHTLEDMLALVDGVGHPCFRTMFDPSHFDLMSGGATDPRRGKACDLLEKVGVKRIGYVHFTDTDGTLRDGGTSKHLAAGDGYLELRRALELLWRGGYEGWLMIDAWEIPDVYDACRKGKRLIEATQRELFGS